MAALHRPEHIKEVIEAAIVNDTLWVMPFFFPGMQGSGKFAAALDVALVLLCESEAEAAVSALPLLQESARLRAPGFSCHHARGARQRAQERRRSTAKGGSTWRSAPRSGSANPTRRLPPITRRRALHPGRLDPRSQPYDTGGARTKPA